MNLVRHARTERVKDAARDLGFDAVGIAEAGPADDDQRFLRWIEAGYAGSMGYMADSAEARRDPRVRVPGARSVVVVAMSYFRPDDPKQGPLRLSRYCRSDDYHTVMKKRVRRLRRVLLEIDPEAGAAPTVDTSPVLERYWAHQAGIAWVGKSTMAIGTNLGTYTFLGCIITTIDLTPDEPHADRCGSCTRCLDACPTQAFVGPRMLDARKCLTYWNVEHRAPYVAETPDLHGWVAGCDVCQDVCPWNKFAAPSREPRFAARPGLSQPDIDVWTNPDRDEDLSALVKGTALQRTTSTHLRRSARRILGLPSLDTSSDTSSAS